jgi:hypothetical protein
MVKLSLGDGPLSPGLGLRRRRRRRSCGHH